MAESYAIEVSLVLDFGETLVRVLHCVLGSQGICNACWKGAVDSKCCFFTSAF